MMRAVIVTTGDSNAYSNFINTDIDLIKESIATTNVEVIRGGELKGDLQSYMSEIGNAIFDCDILFILSNDNPKSYSLISQAIANGLSMSVIKSQKSSDTISECAFNRNENLPLDHIADFSTIPEAAILLPSNTSYVQSYAVTSQKQLIFVLPICPSEISKIFRGSVTEYIISFCERNAPAEQNIYSDISMKVKHVIKAADFGKKSVGELLQPYLNNNNPTISCVYKQGDYAIILNARREGNVSPDTIVQNCLEQLRDVLGECIYCYSDRFLWDITCEMLYSHEITLAVAETGTKGVFSDTLSFHEYIDKIFKDGSVFKGQERLTSLNIPVWLVDKHGVTGKSVATAMAYSAMQKAHTSLGIAITVKNDEFNNDTSICTIALTDGENVWCKHLTSEHTSEEHFKGTAMLYGYNMLRLYCESYGNTMAGAEPIKNILKNSLLKKLKK